MKLPFALFLNGRAASRYPALPASPDPAAAVRSAAFEQSRGPLRTSQPTACRPRRSCRKAPMLAAPERPCGGQWPTVPPTVSVILQVVSGAIATAVLPFFSKLSNDRNWTELRSVLRVYSRWILLATTVAALTLMLLSEPLIGIVLERGAFSGGDTVLVGRIQAVYALQIPFYVCGMIFVRVISALKANQILLVGSFLYLTINIALNYIFMSIWGVVGIALSTACVYLFSCAFVMIMGYRMLRRDQRIDSA